MTCERCNAEDGRSVVLSGAIPATLCRPCSRLWALRFVAHAAAVKLRAVRLQMARYARGRARRLPSPLELARDESWALQELQQLAVDFLSAMKRAPAEQAEELPIAPEIKPETAQLPL